MSLRNRIEKLEASNTGAAIIEDEQEPLWGNYELTRKLMGAVRELYESLSDEHKLIFDNDLDALYVWYYRAASVPGCVIPSLSPITRACSASLLDFLDGHLTAADLEAGLAFLRAIDRTQKILNSMGEQYRGEVEAWLYERNYPICSPLVEMFLDVEQPQGFNGQCYLVPAELPPNACELFKMNEAEWGNFNAGYSENCEDCGYPAPTLHVAPKRDNETKGAIETKVIRLWESCIICGGVTGWRAYQIKHKHQGYAHLTPYGERAKDEPEKPS